MRYVIETYPRLRTNEKYNPNNARKNAVEFLFLFFNYEPRILMYGSLITSSSEIYISNQFENIRSMEFVSIMRSGHVTSKHIKDVFL